MSEITKIRIPFTRTVEELAQHITKFLEQPGKLAYIIEQGDYWYDFQSQGFETDVNFFITEKLVESEGVTETEQDEDEIRWEQELYIRAYGVETVNGELNTDLDITHAQFSVKQSFTLVIEGGN